MLVHTASIPLFPPRFVLAKHKTVTTAILGLLGKAGLAAITLVEFAAAPVKNTALCLNLAALQRMRTPMIEWIAVLAVCQLAGEAAAQAAHLPIPGPVFGMAFLFAAVAVNGRVPEGLGKVADALLLNLSLLFVPAGVGIMLHFKLLESDWLPLSAALILSTLLTIGVTASLMAFLSRKTQPRPKGEAK